MDTQQLENLIGKCLQDFYARRLERLRTLKLKDYLKRKNPYLFKAVGTEKASEIVEDILTAYIMASDESIFGDAFFEPIAKMASGGVVAPAEGVDVGIEFPNRYLAIAVKSGPNIFNASQKRKQNDEFHSLRSRLFKIHKQFDALVGHCYGRLSTESSKTKIYRDRSGQVFWAEITADDDFYLKLVRLMKDRPIKHRVVYKKSWDQAVNRFTAEFISEFCKSDGSIDWEKLVGFNSGSAHERAEKRKR
ncbi:MAG TPA: PmeII family type II restriction endonuclease [Candidatus Deferrimicrobium sp.]|nr:PmeII family type II restriction endonuclease [Candidatus Deferrimicrobium sp.]